MEEITTIVLDVLFGCFRRSVLTWTVIGVRAIVRDHREEKRREAAAKRDEEYHAEHMRALGK